jgi:hypothetical protein
VGGEIPPHITGGTMSYWMIISKPDQPTPGFFEYVEDMEQVNAVALLRTKSEELGSGLTLWKLIKHTTVNVNSTVVDD